MNKQIKYMTISMIANVFLCIFKIIFGIISNTRSLIADGIHSFSDLSTDIIAIVGSKISQKPADIEHPKGHGKVDYVTSLIISLFIIFIGLSLIKKCTANDNYIPDIKVSIIVVITIITKYFLSKFLIKKGKKINSMILITSGKESYTDVYSSILVLVVILLSQLHNKISFFKYCDIIGTITISFLILTVGFRLLKENLSFLIGRVEQDEKIISDIGHIIKNRNANFDYTGLTIFKLGTYYDVTFKILVDGDLTIKEGHDLMDDIEKDLLCSSYNIKYVTIHIEPK